MSDIQLDMFEVQLGAALLLQFNTEKGAVRILADAGISASGYPIEHVHSKLPEALSAFGDNDKRLDLIVGTHYDADHLEGLVPIINDLSIEIGEAWMPPVANDTDPHASNESVQEHHLLGQQFLQEDGEDVLLRYLDAKHYICKELRELEGSGIEFRATEARLRNFRKHDFPPYPEQSLARGGNRNECKHDFNEHLKHFKEHLKDANDTLGIYESSHADDDMDDSYMMDIQGHRTKRVVPLLHGQAKDRLEFFESRWSKANDLAGSDARSLAYIRQAGAKDAINAAALFKVVKALRKRGIPILWRMIQDGQPRRFMWQDSGRKFIPSSRQTASGPEFMLMGPSEGLIRKHWNRLPIGSYMAAFVAKEIPIKNITPSNQLSYVLRFKFKGQGILVTGDAGFVDFKSNSNGRYSQALLNALLPLHLIQIAHHGGNNAHFYRVLLDADYPAQLESSLLLISHATDDTHRPSKEFGMFVEQVRRDGDDVKLLFTSRPKAEKVQDYTELIYPVVGQVGDVGDIRISFDSGNWVVQKHAIQV